MLRPRLTIRRLMIAVAVAGIIFGAIVVGFRWSSYRRMADMYHRRVHDKSLEIQLMERVILSDPERSRMARQVGDVGFADYLLDGVREAESRLPGARAELEELTIQAAKYERAARNFWLPAERDRLEQP